MKKGGIALAVILTAIALLLILFAPNASAVSCGRITTSTTMDQNLNVTNSSCFSIEGSNLTLNCNGFSIFFFGNGAAINASGGRANVSVVNCGIYDNNTGGANTVGINFSNTWGTIRNNTIIINDTSGGLGIALDTLGSWASNVNMTITNNTINSSGSGTAHKGIAMVGTPSAGTVVNVTYNVVRTGGGNSGVGIGLHGAGVSQRGVYVTQNQIFVGGTGNGAAGIDSAREWNVSFNNIIVTGTSSLTGIDMGTSSITAVINDNNVTVNGTSGGKGFGIGGGSGNSKDPYIIANNTFIVVGTTQTVGLGFSTTTANGTKVDSNNITILGTALNAAGSSSIVAVTTVFNFSMTNNVFNAGGLNIYTIRAALPSTSTWTNNTIESTNASITFVPTITLSDQSNFTFRNFNMSFNRITLNVTNLTAWNVPSIITLRNLSFANANATWNDTDFNSMSDCPPSKCTLINYSNGGAGGNGVLKFNVSGYTQYGAQDFTQPPPPPPQGIDVPLLINITDPKGASTNYTLEIELNTSLLIKSGLMASDCSDLQVRYNNASIPWTFGYLWNESACGAGTARNTSIITFFVQSNLTDGTNISTAYTLNFNSSGRVADNDRYNFSYSEVFVENATSYRFTTIPSCGATAATDLTVSGSAVQFARKPLVAAAPQGGYQIIAPVVRMNSSYTVFVNWSSTANAVNAQPTIGFMGVAIPRHEWDSTCADSFSTSNGSVGINDGTAAGYASFNPAASQTARAVVRKVDGGSFTNKKVASDVFAYLFRRDPKNFTWSNNTVVNATTSISGGFGFNFTVTERYFLSFVAGSSIDGQAAQEDATMREAALAGTPIQFNQANWTNSTPAPDAFAPNVTLLAPPSGYSTFDKIIDVVFRATDNVASSTTCSIMVNATTVNSSITALNNTATNVYVNLTNFGTYFWNATCLDTQLNSNTSLTRNFTITNGTSRPGTVFLTPPTPANNSALPTNSYIVNVSIYDDDPLSNITLNTTGTTQSLFPSANNVTNNTQRAFVAQLTNLTHSLQTTGNNTNCNLTTYFSSVSVGQVDVYLNGFALGSILTTSVSPITFANIGYACKNGTNVANYAPVVTFTGNIDSSNLSWVDKIQVLSKNITGALEGTNYVEVIANETDGNRNTTGVIYFSIDAFGPAYSNNVTVPASPVIYSATARYNFSVDWTNNIASVTMKDNFTSVNVSTPVFNISGTNQYNRTVGPLAAAGYTWSQNATDTNARQNTTTTMRFDVQQAVPNVTITLSTNPSQYNVSTTATCTVNSSQLSVTLWRNGTVVANPDTSTLAAGNWDYNCNSTGNQNFTTPANTTLTLVVNQAQGKMNLTLNLTGQNWTIGVGSSLGILAQKINGTGNFDVFLNGTPIGSTSSSFFTIQNFSGPGIYNVSSKLNGTQNFSSNVSSLMVTVLNSQPTIVLNSPLNNTQFNDSGIVLFNWTAIDDYNTSTFCNLSINGTVYAGNVSLNNTQTTLQTNIPFGRNSWNVTCIDGYTSNTSVTQYVLLNDTHAPALTLNSPTNASVVQSTTNTSNVTFSWTATDARSGTFNCTFQLNGTNRGDNITTNNTPTFRTEYNLSMGPRTWNVTCTDTDGMKNSSGLFNFNLTLITKASISLSTGITNATFNANMSSATYALLKSGNFSFIVNLTSYNNSFVNQTANKSLYNISTVGSSFNPSNITINVTGTSGGPGRIRCAPSFNLSNSTVLSSSNYVIARWAPGIIAGIWCWGDYLNASSQYNFTIGVGQEG